jgi:hypothetical protein
MNDKLSVASFYVIKGVRLLLIWMAVTVAARLFETDYVEKVYGKGEPAPSLTSMIFIVAIAMLVFNALLAAGLVAFTADFSGRRELFSFNKDLIQAVALDSIFHTVIVVVGGYIVAGVIQKKKYFQYKTEGVRAIRAAKEVIMAFAIPFMLVPFFGGVNS